MHGVFSDAILFTVGVYPAFAFFVFYIILRKFYCIVAVVIFCENIIFSEVFSDGIDVNVYIFSFFLISSVTLRIIWSMSPLNESSS